MSTPWPTLDDAARRALVIAAVSVAAFGCLSLAGAGEHAAALAGTEGGLSVLFGLAFVVARLFAIVVAPICVLGGLLSWTTSWLFRRSSSRRCAPSRPPAA